MRGLAVPAKTSTAPLRDTGRWPPGERDALSKARPKPMLTRRLTTERPRSSSRLAFAPSARGRLENLSRDCARGSSPANLSRTWALSEETLCILCSTLSRDLAASNRVRCASTSSPPPSLENRACLYDFGVDAVLNDDCARLLDPNSDGTVTSPDRVRPACPPAPADLPALSIAMTSLTSDARNARTLPWSGSE